MTVCRIPERIFLRAAAGVSSIGLLVAGLHADLPQNSPAGKGPIVTSPATVLATTTPLPSPSAAPRTFAREQILDLAKTDPQAVWRLGLEKYEREVKDYSCTFTKREFVGGKLKDEEEIDVRFREAPQSVFMFWKRGEDQVKRALYVDSPKFRDSKGQKTAKIEPAGAVIRLIVSEVEMPIHGKEAKEASRRTIDEFGFKNTYAILDKFNNLADRNGVLEYSFEGEDKIGGRPTYRFVRNLPYQGEKGTYPDAKMVLHLDQEWLLPTAVFSYADKEGKKLLGSYVYTNIKLNPGYSERDFQF